MTGRASESYGQAGMSWVDRLGVWLSRRAIVRWLPDRSDLTVLELGCGFRATHLRSLRDRFRHGVGVDFRIAAELRAVPGLEFHEGAIEDVLPRLGRDSFDVVLLISVLEHLSDPESTLRAVRSLLRPGGVLLINVPTWRGKVFLEFSAFRLGLSPQVEMDDHKMYYAPRDLWPLLVRAGFRPSRIRIFHHKFRLNLFAVVHKSDDA